jgi:cell division protein FtsN
MTKDYKEPNNHDPQPGGYGWMFSGIALGLLVGLGMYFYANYQNASSKPTDSAETSASTSFGEQETQENGELQEPDPISMVIESARLEQHDRKRASFSYYAVLPNLELDVNVKPSSKDKKSPEEIAALEAAEAKAIEKVILKPGMHILQIASFKTEPQARRSQKKLLTNGLETRIEKRKIKGKFWFRLFAGPTQESVDIDGWNAIAKKTGFSPIVVKVK